MHTIDVQFTPRGSNQTITIPLAFTVAGKCLCVTKGRWVLVSIITALQAYAIGGAFSVEVPAVWKLIIIVTTSH